MGPQGLVVAYSPTWEVTNKALVGFLTPEKKAQYGLLGVYIVDNQFGGVEIQSVTKDSGADSAGLEVGDVIIDISGVMIRNQIDFSRATYRMIPGTTILIKVRRKVEILTVLVTVGTQHAQIDGHQQSSTELSDSLEIH
jgi:S1-C subfamily serine protease